MAKKGKCMKSRINPKNPLNCLKTRDLLITLICLLLLFGVGFGIGFSCARYNRNNRISASADVLSVSDTYNVPIRAGQGNGGQQYVFNMYLGNDLYTANFVLYEEYSSAYLSQSHWLALASDNSITPHDYVVNQLYEYTSEDEYFGLEILPTASNVEYELYYTFYSDDEPNIYYYDYETLYDSYSTITYSNLSEGGFNGKLSYFFTCYKGFGIVLENGSYWAIDMRSERWGNMRDLISLGMGNIYTYDDLFKIGYDVDVDSLINDAYLDGKSDGYDLGKIDGEEIGYYKGLNESFGDITPWEHIVSGVNSFLALQIFPGVSFSIIISLAFGIILLGIVWKTFLGG